MSSAPRKSWWPLLGLIALLLVSLLDLQQSLRTPTHSAVFDPQLQSQLAALLAQGDSRGYAAALKAHPPAASLYLEVLDRDGQAMAVWPAPYSAARWSVFAGPLQHLRLSLVRVLGNEQRTDLIYQGRVVGELLLYHAQGVVGLNRQAWFSLFCLLLALLGLWSLRGRGAGAVAPAANTVSTQEGGQASGGEQLAMRIAQSTDAAQLGLIALDESACVSFMNQVAQRLTAWPLDEARGLPLGSVLRVEGALADEADGPALSQRLGQLDEAGLACRIRLRSRNENVLPVALHQLPLTADVGGKPGGALISITDVSKPQAERNALRREAGLAAKTLDFMSDGLAVTNRYGRISRSNRKLQQLFDYSGPEIEGMTVSKLMPVPFLNDAAISLKDYLPGAIAESPAVVGWRKDASTFAVDLQVQELFDDEQAYLLLVRDRAARQQNENLARRLNTLVASSPDALLLVDAETTYVNAANPQALQQLGYSEERLRRMSLTHLLPELELEALQQLVAELKRAERPWQDLVSSVRYADGSRLQSRLRLSWSGEEEPPLLLVFIGPD